MDFFCSKIVRIKSKPKWNLHYLCFYRFFRFLVMKRCSTEYFSVNMNVPFFMSFQLPFSTGFGHMLQKRAIGKNIERDQKRFREKNWNCYRYVFLPLTAFSGGWEWLPNILGEILFLLFFRWKWLENCPL